MKKSVKNPRTSILVPYGMPYTRLYGWYQEFARIAQCPGREASLQQALALPQEVRSRREALPTSTLDPLELHFKQYNQGQLYYSGQKWAFWGWIRWGHFFKKQLWPNYRSHKVPQGIKWKLRILSFQWYPMSILGSSSLDTTALQSWAFFQKI